VDGHQPPDSTAEAGQVPCARAFGILMVEEALESGLEGDGRVFLGPAGGVIAENDQQLGRGRGLVGETAPECQRHPLRVGDGPELAAVHSQLAPALLSEGDGVGFVCEELRVALPVAAWKEHAEVAFRVGVAFGDGDGVFHGAVVLLGAARNDKPKNVTPRYPVGWKALE